MNPNQFLNHLVTKSESVESGSVVAALMLAVIFIVAGLLITATIVLAFSVSNLAGLAWLVAVIGRFMIWGWSRVKP